VSVGTGSVVERAVVLQGAEIGEHCVVRNAIVAAGARIGDRSHITNGAVLGEGVTIGADCVVSEGARVSPGVDNPDGGLTF
jgi:mannose-1-phosphate guanylyltransferase